MMTITSFTCTGVRQALKWTVLAGAVLVMGQATVLAGDSVSVLMKQALADMVGKVATVAKISTKSWRTFESCQQTSGN